MNTGIDGIDRPQRVVSVDGSIDAQGVADDAFNVAGRSAKAARNSKVAIGVVNRRHEALKNTARVLGNVDEAGDVLPLPTVGKDLNARSAISVCRSSS